MQVPENATSIKAYPQGQWYGPCYWSDQGCFQRLDAGMAAGNWSMEELVGAHRYRNSWG